MGILGTRAGLLSKAEIAEVRGAIAQLRVEQPEHDLLMAICHTLELCIEAQRVVERAEWVLENRYRGKRDRRAYQRDYMREYREGKRRRGKG